MWGGDLAGVSQWEGGREGVVLGKWLMEGHGSLTWPASVTWRV